MRNLTESDLLIFMSPGRELRLRVDVLRDGIRVSEELAPEGFTPTAFEVSWDLSGEIKQVAHVNIVYAHRYGESIVPRDFEAMLGPWGNDIDLTLEARLGEQIASVPVGQLMITAVPEATDSSGKYRLQGRRIVTGSMLTIRAKSQDERIRRNGFSQVTLKPTKISSWDEIVRLTGMLVARNVPDKSPPQLEYERAQGDRLKQVHALAAHLGGVAVVDAYGVLNIVPDTVGEPVARLEGTILEAPYSVESDDVYNEVIGSFEDEARNPIVVEPARITSGPLAVGGPYGTYSRFYASEFVKTKAAAQSALQKILQQVSKPSFAQKFTAMLDPRMEIGDTWTIVTPNGEEITGLVTAIKWDGDVMEGTLQYQEDVYA
ncbi:hypothetical protein PV375_01205 [Gulosibacter sp. GYB002]|uniref:hypothetical protein n=1 Tax=Gulosibacter sp. GYB002 TaxID=2994391 RepID=UPI002F96C77C